MNWTYLFLKIQLVFKILCSFLLILLEVKAKEFFRYFLWMISIIEECSSNFDYFLYLIFYIYKIVIYIYNIVCLSWRRCALLPSICWLHKFDDPQVGKHKEEMQWQKFKWDWTGSPFQSWVPMWHWCREVPHKDNTAWAHGHHTWRFDKAQA